MVKAKDTKERRIQQKLRLSAVQAVPTRKHISQKQLTCLFSRRVKHSPSVSVIVNSHLLPPPRFTGHFGQPKKLPPWYNIVVLHVVWLNIQRSDLLRRWYGDVCDQWCDILFHDVMKRGGNMKRKKLSLRRKLQKVSKCNQNWLIKMLGEP